MHDYLRELREEVASQDRKHGENFDAETAVGKTLLAVAVAEDEIFEVLDALSQLVGYELPYSEQVRGDLRRAWRDDRKAEKRAHLRAELRQVKAVADRALRQLDRLEKPQQPAFYLAASYDRMEEMRQKRDELERMGYRVTSRWISGQQGTITEAEAAQQDLDDLLDAETVISFHDSPSTQGGRHCEFGEAHAHGKRIMAIGPFEHVFTRLPEIEHYDSWDDVVRALTAVEAEYRDLTAGLV